MNGSNRSRFWHMFTQHDKFSEKNFLQNACPCMSLPLFATHAANANKHNPNEKNIGKPFYACLCWCSCLAQCLFLSYMHCLCSRMIHLISCHEQVVLSTSDGTNIKERLILFIVQLVSIVLEQLTNMTAKKQKIKRKDRCQMISIQISTKWQSQNKKNQ